MKKLKNPLGIVLLAAILAFSFAACDNPADPVVPPPPKDFTGNVTISPDGTSTIYTGATLTADYDGEEDVTLTYQWSRSKDGVVTQVGTGIQFNTQTDGDYTVTISAAGYNSKPSAAVTVTDDGKSKFEGDITISPDGPVEWGTTLTAAYDGDETGLTLTYTWYNKDDVQVATGNTYTPSLGTGSYYVIANDPDYTPKQSKNTVTVTLKTLAGTVNIQSDGTTVTTVTVDTPLTASYTGGSENVTLSWFNTNSDISIRDDANFTPTETGSYYVVASLSGYTNIQSNTVTVTLKTLAGTVSISPSGNNVFVDTPLTAHYNGNEPVSVSYQWYKGSTPIDGATDVMYTPTEAGSYYVVVSADGYNPNPSNTVNVISDSTNTLKITMHASIFAKAASGYQMAIFPAGTDINKLITQEIDFEPIAISDDDMDGFDYEESGSNYIVTAPFYRTSNDDPWTENGTFDVIAMLLNDDGETISVYEYNNLTINGLVTPVIISQSDFVTTRPNEPPPVGGDNDGPGTGTVVPSLTADIDPALRNTNWVEASFGATMLTLSFTDDEITWGGMYGDAIDSSFAEATVGIDGDYAWVFNNDVCGIKYNDPSTGSVATHPIYQYTLSENQLVIWPYGTSTDTSFTLNKQP